MIKVLITITNIILFSFIILLQSPTPPILCKSIVRNMFERKSEWPPKHHERVKKSSVNNIVAEHNPFHQKWVQNGHNSWSCAKLKYPPTYPFKVYLPILDNPSPIQKHLKKILCRRKQQCKMKTLYRKSKVRVIAQKIFELRLEPYFIVSKFLPMNLTFF